MLDEAAYFLGDAPELIERQKDSTFTLNGKRYKAEQLGLSPAMNHALILPMREGYFIDEPKKFTSTKKQDVAGINTAVEYNHAQAKNIADALLETCHIPFSVHHADLPPHGACMVIGTHAPHAAELLDDMGEMMLNKHQRSVKAENQWRDHCDERSIEHRAPRR